MLGTETPAYDELFLFSPHAALRVRDGKIDDCNAAAGRLLGDGWKGRPLKALLGFGQFESLDDALRSKRIWYRPDWSGSGIDGDLLMLPFQDSSVFVIYNRQPENSDEEMARVMLNIDQHLRVQLTNLQFAHSALERELGDGLSSRAASNLAMIQQMLLRLTRLSGNMRDVARFLLRAEELDAESVDLAGLCRRVAGNCAEYAARRNVAVKFNCAHDELIVQADEARLERLLLNLLSNAFVYGSDGGTVCVEISTNGNTLVLSVSDDGRGMDASEVAGLFNAYRSAVDMSSAGRHGMGLGLPLVQHIARLHGGTALVDAKPGEGLRVVVSIPYIPGERAHVFRDSMVDYTGGFDPSRLEMSVLPMV